MFLMKTVGLDDKKSNSDVHSKGGPTVMELKEIIKILMMSELYFSLPLWERKEVVWRLWSQYGQGPMPYRTPWPKPLIAPPPDDHD